MGTACICRLDGSKTHGWQVRVGPKRGYHSKLFSDGVYGSKGKALVAAEAYLDEFVKQHPELAPQNKNGQPPNVPYWEGDLLSNNKSGRTGVYRSHEYLDSGNLSEYWGASYPIGPNGGHGGRVFRINVYGDKQAKELAMAYRHAWEQACEADELDRFFALSDYPVRFTYTPNYYHQPDSTGQRKAHILRRDDFFWCGKELTTPPWYEMTEPPSPEEICQGCRSQITSYENLVNMLLYYHQQADETGTISLNFYQSLIGSHPQ